MVSLDGINGMGGLVGDCSVAKEDLENRKVFICIAFPHPSSSSCGLQEWESSELTALSDFIEIS